MPNYSHPEWRKKRKTILDDRNHQCENCTSKQNLQVHHKKYISGRRVWQYANDELQVLCANCHREEHGLGGKMKTCSYRGCDWEIEPQYEYCFKHKQTVADEKMDEASIKMQRAEEMKKEVERLKDELDSGGKDFDRYEKLEKQMMQIQDMLAKQLQLTTSSQNSNTNRINEPEQRRRASSEGQDQSKKKTGFLKTVAIIIAIVIGIVFFKSESYDCYDCGAPMVERTNGKTGKKFYGCSTFPKCRNTTSSAK